jgi:2'-5' RNA ligase
MKVQLSTVVYPNSKLKNRIRQFMKKISTKYKTYHDVSKAVGPHITVNSMDDVDKKHLKEIFYKIRKICLTTSPFLVKIGGINFFDNNIEKGQTAYVIYIPVERTAKFVAFQKKLEKVLVDYGRPHSRGFVPHIALAHADLQKRYFLKAKKELNVRFSGKFYAKRLEIFIFEPKSRRWTRMKNFYLASD